MEDLSLHILDVVENSIDAGAKKIMIKVCEDVEQDLLTIEIVDDGKGMDADTLKKSDDPFFTTKTTRKVGLGLALLKEAAEMAKGTLSINSEIGKGTRIKTTFQHSHIDRKPLGNIASTLMTLIVGHPEIEFEYLYYKDGREHRFATKELTKEGDLRSKDTLEIMRLLKKHLLVIQ